MNDTSADMEERYWALLMQRTGEERLKMGCAMRDTARAFVEASLREKNPDATVAAIRQGLFLHFYGHEFDAPTRARILAEIAQAAGRVIMEFKRSKPDPESCTQGFGGTVNWQVVGSTFTWLQRSIN